MRCTIIVARHTEIASAIVDTREVWEVRPILGNDMTSGSQHSYNNNNNHIFLVVFTKHIFRVIFLRKRKKNIVISSIYLKTENVAKTKQPLTLPTSMLLDKMAPCTTATRL